MKRIWLPSLLVIGVTFQIAFWIGFASGRATMREEFAKHGMRFQSGTMTLRTGERGEMR